MRSVMLRMPRRAAEQNRQAVSCVREKEGVGVAEGSQKAVAEKQVEVGPSMGCMNSHHVHVEYWYCSTVEARATPGPKYHLPLRRLHALTRFLCSNRSMALQ